MAEFLVSDPAVQDAHPHTQYDLIANVCHEGEPSKGRIVSPSISINHSSSSFIAPSSFYKGNTYKMYK